MRESCCPGCCPRMPMPRLPSIARRGWSSIGGLHLTSGSLWCCGAGDSRAQQRSCQPPISAIYFLFMQTERTLNALGAGRERTMTATHDSPTGWYKELRPSEKRTFWACFGGWALDAMDVQIFSFAIPAIIAAFALTNADAGLIGTVTLLTSAFGGWFAGALSDRFGRVRTLQITIVWFAFFTFLCGFAQSYGQLFAFRALMGLGFGGEWAAGAVLMGEVIRAQHRGKAVGSVQSGWAVGWAIAALVATLLFSAFPQETAWRVLFWIGVLPAVVVFFVCRL